MQPKTIVAGLDFSDASTTAVRWVAEHFAPGAELILAHAVHVPRPPSFLRPLAITGGPTLERAREEAARRIAAFAGSLARPARVEVMDGRPADVLARLAASAGADLVAIGAHGNRPASRLGTTADRLVRASDRPVLVIRHPPPAAPAVILAAVDDSELTDAVLAWAASLARAWDARTTALHVLGPESYAEMTLGAVEPAGGGREDVREAAVRWLSDRVGRAAFPAGRASAEVVFEDPAFEIVRRTERDGIELVVMGSRGAGAVSRALLGSVASLVVRNARCPVLVV